MSYEYTSTRDKRDRIPDVLKEKAATMLRAGVVRIDVARACGISTASVSGIAKKQGIKYVRCPTGSRFMKAPRITVVTTEPAVNWAGIKANARWGSGFGA